MVRHVASGFALIAVLTLPRVAAADQVIADDAIVQGNNCIGLDCVNDEAFGTDTLRLKENNTRIKFDDTSTNPGDPNHDWQLVANDSASGARNQFSIQDDTAVTVPFTILGNAATNALFVDATGKVGLGTSTPGATLDVAGDLAVSGTLTVGALNIPTTVSVDAAALTGSLTAGSAFVDGNAAVGGNLVVTGKLNGRDLDADGALLDTLAAAPSSTKAGVIPISAFSTPRRTATVTFTSPFAAGEDYGLTFVEIGHGGRQGPRPFVLSRDAGGFTVALGNRKVPVVTAVQWVARRAGT